MQIDAVISLIDVDVCSGKVHLILKTGAGGLDLLWVDPLEPWSDHLFVERLEL